MKDLLFGCNETDKLVDGTYTYVLYTRIDGYAVIAKGLTSGLDTKYLIVLQTEVVDTVWAGATGKTYVRPDKMSVQARKYATTKMNSFNTMIGSDIS